MMVETPSPTMCELLAWIAGCRRTYGEAMEAWRSTCPRHTEWEDALLAGLIHVERGNVPELDEVMLTQRGQALLDVGRSGSL